MALLALENTLYEGVLEIPAIDIHTHLVGGKLGARGLHDIILYHMAVSDLYAAGCPSGARLNSYPGWPSKEEAYARLREALPFFAKARNTSISWGARMILRDLYGWTEPVTAENWERLDTLVRERANDTVWQRDVTRRAGIQRYSTEWARREGGEDSDILSYALEWAFFTRCQWGEYDTALYELERTWGRAPECPIPVTAGNRPPTERMVRSVEDVQAAVAHYVSQLAQAPIIASTTHLSTDINYTVVSDQEMADALSRRETAGPRERDIYASYIHEHFLTALEAHADRLVFQFSFGAEPLPYETASRLNQRTLLQLAEMIGRHPRLRFQCMNASHHAEQTLCTLCRELPNLSLAGYWWHNFFPATIRDMISQRLEMLPVNRQIGFFSDAYCVEWAYAKSRLVRRQLAAVLATKVEQGQYSEDDALSIAREILLASPRELLGMTPAPALMSVE